MSKNKQPEREVYQTLVLQKKNEEHMLMCVIFHSTEKLSQEIVYIHV